MMMDEGPPSKRCKISDEMQQMVKVPKWKLIQHRLFMLLHAAKCTTKVCCSVSHCHTMRNVLEHMKNCDEGLQCREGFMLTCLHGSINTTIAIGCEVCFKIRCKAGDVVTHCASSRKIIAHWKQCKRPNCIVCPPLRKKFTDLPNHQSALTSEVGVNPGIRKELAEQLITPEAARRTCAASSIKVLEEFCDLTSEPGKDYISTVERSLWIVFMCKDSINRFGLLKKKTMSRFEGGEDNVDCDAQTAIDDVFFATPVLGKDRVNDNQAPYSSPSGPSACSEKLQPTVDANFVISFFRQCSKYPRVETLLTKALSSALSSVGFWISVCTSNYLNLYVVLMEYFAQHNVETITTAFANFCHALGGLRVFTQVALVEFWSDYCAADLQRMVESLQRFLTAEIASQGSDDSAVLQSRKVISAVKCLNILYYASILGGIKETNMTPDRSATEFCQGNEKQEVCGQGTAEKGELDWTDELGKKMQFSGLDTAEPKVAFAKFINEDLNKIMKAKDDYDNFRQSCKRKQNFSFLQYPFLLNTFTKTAYFFHDDRVRSSENRRASESSDVEDSETDICLVLKVQRNDIVGDTFAQLESTIDNGSGFAKRLFVEFDGEEGADDGGLTQEFFGVLVQRLFDPDNGVFVQDEDTRLVLFNRHSLESLEQYRLIGVILGLAIYNQCLVDVRFPSFIYKKLLGRRANLLDMKDVYPVIHRSLIGLLESEGDVEETFMMTFEAHYRDMFGELHNQDLKHGGAEIPVTNDNRQEYVDLHVDWLLNKSIEEQFNAFRSGFDLVWKDSLLRHLFLPHELKLIIRGREEYDFEELERTTTYKGFTPKSRAIKNFWSVVHKMTAEEKRALLQFFTGSDRVPLGGLSELKLVVEKNGPDSDWLPTAATCYHVILMPNYRNKTRLKDRLLKALEHTKGFGLV